MIILGSVVAVIDDSGNAITSQVGSGGVLSRTAEGKYTFTFDVEQPDTNYGVAFGARFVDAAGSAIPVVNVDRATGKGLFTDHFDIAVRDPASDGGSDFFDPVYLSVMVYDPVGASGFTKPLLADFTFESQPSGCSATDLPSSLKITQGGGVDFGRLVQPVPSAPYTRWVSMSQAPYNVGDYTNLGICLTDGSGKSVTFVWEVNKFDVPAYSGGLRVDHYASTAVNGTSSTAFNGLTPGIGAPSFLGIHDDGTDVHFLASYDGAAVVEIYSESNTAYLTATDIGFPTLALGAGNRFYVSHWGEALPGVPLGGTTAQVQSLMVACSDEVSDLVEGDAITVRMPYSLSLSEVRASLSEASSSGPVEVDVKAGGVSIFSTTLTIDAGETTSKTAATPAVISDPDLADDDEITFDILDGGTGAAGLKVTLIGRH